MLSAGWAVMEKKSMLPVAGAREVDKHRRSPVNNLGFEGRTTLENIRYTGCWYFTTRCEFAQTSA